MRALQAADNAATRRLRRLKITVNYELLLRKDVFGVGMGKNLLNIQFKPDTLITASLSVIVMLRSSPPVGTLEACLYLRR